MSVLLHFEEYQKARVKFVQAIAEAATRPQNIEVMNNAGVMQLLRPLLLDNVPSIQQTAALALGRLANYSEDLAEAVVGNEILPQLVYSLSDQNVRNVTAITFLFSFFSLFFLFFSSFHSVSIRKLLRLSFGRSPNIHLSWHKQSWIPVLWKH